MRSRQTARKAPLLNVRYEVDGAIAVVTINRPGARNAVNSATAEELVACFKRFDADDSLSVAILTGAGGNFCAGFDLKEVAQGRANRLSAKAPWSLSLARAIKAEYDGGVKVVASGESQAGAREFVKGKGRHGSD